MKRLIKKASITLYHGTCVEYLRKIQEAGALVANASSGAGKNRNYDGSSFSGFVFLATTQQVALNFANYIPPQQTQAHVVIELMLDESKLLPDDDDDPNAKTWQDSANSLQQVKVGGDVSTSTFTQIYFYNRYTGELVFQSSLNGWEELFQQNKENLDIYDEE